MKKVRCTRSVAHDGDHVACGAIALKHAVLTWKGDDVTGGSQSDSVRATREMERATLPEVFEADLPPTNPK
jgi:hypothetical protein